MEEEGKEEEEEKGEMLPLPFGDKGNCPESSSLVSYK